MRSYKADQIANVIQGVLDAKSIIRNLLVISTQNTDGWPVEKLDSHQKKMDDVKVWLEEWLNAHDKDSVALGNFAFTLTGSTGVGGEIKIDIKNINAYTYPHSCFDTLEVSPEVDKKTFFIELDAIGRGERKGYTTG